jgi:hypothetical protein
VFPSENSTELTQDQRKAAAHVRTMYSKLSEEMAMTEKVTAINELQMALISYLRHSLFSPSFVDSTATLSLQQALGEQGSVVELLRGYNDTARQWNGLRAVFRARCSARRMRCSRISALTETRNSSRSSPSDVRRGKLRCFFLVV